MAIDDTITDDNEVQPAGGEQLSGPAELRAALDRERATRKALETKLASRAFTEAGFAEGTKERKALERFYDGDKTDPVAIAKFAEEELGYSVSAEVSKVAHVDPAPTVVADARSDLLDASAADTLAGDKQSELAKKRDALLGESIKPGADNRDLVQAAMAAELERAGFPPLA